MSRVTALEEAIKYAEETLADCTDAHWVNCYLCGRETDTTHNMYLDGNIDKDTFICDRCQLDEAVQNDAQDRLAKLNVLTGTSEES
jgi:hypothetical protein